ncbi:SGNH/GDSL hydrolase family protein [Microbulbifer halophilus]|uniref:SGNH/GDSL hydrolase family protein n=1 Tax=Microbulbifer halophilus TaxID=453963 RepID=A0ABW5EGV9_9GAMM|nr:SGNH/GDSL hydrolase family protein [Microbulbifer halophilus]MCW8128619.1 SGNH/GDSL hydrolase family protein [Microbulbifer halophilus]
MKRIIALTAILCLALVSARVPAATRVDADAEALQYTGRIDFSDRKAPLLSWPGSSIEANFTGTSLALVLDDEQGNNYYNVIVDGNRRHPFVLQAKKGEHRYEIGYGLSPGKHSLEIVKRTEGAEGATAFKGLLLSDDARLLPPPERPERRMEIYGDSISCGMGNEGADNGRDDLASEKNNYWAYGSVAARRLDAELHTICRSGIGIMVSWFPFTMPQYYDQLSAVGDNDSRWDFSRWTPDVVVINLFQNDSWLIDREKRLDPIPSDKERIQAYVDFVRSIRAKYPEAQIICALGSMDATANDKWPDYIRAAVKQMRSEFDDEKLATLFFDYTGYGQHPRIAQHVANGEKLAAFIKRKMDW